MRTSTVIVQVLIRLTWLILLALGILLWTTPTPALVSIHQILGTAFVLMLVVLAYRGTRCGVNPGLIGVVILWAALVLVFGLVQTRVMPGGAHWIVQVGHLLVGVAAMALAEVLGVRIRRQLARP